MTKQRDPARVRSILAERYGIRAERMAPGERGTVAETWVVDAPQGSFFVKAVPIGRHSALLERSVPIQDRLWHAGFTQMNRPVATPGGDLTVPLGEHILVVYERVDGVATNEYPFEPYVDMLAVLHGMSVDVDDQVERFAVDRTQLAGSAVAMALEGRDPDPVLVAVREALTRLGPSFERDVAEARRLQARLRDRDDLAMVITHNDAPGNVMVETGGRLVLVDWDELLLAPRERDTWPQLIDAEAAPRFLARYRRTAPDYEPDPDVVRHYLLTWYFEELDGLIEWSHAPDATPERRAQVWGWFQASIPRLQDAIRRLERGERPWASVPTAQERGEP